VQFSIERGGEHILSVFTAKLKQIAKDFNIFKGETFTMGNSLLDVVPFVPSLDKPIFNKDLELEIECSLYAPLEQGDLKRGVLLSGSYGTGKSSIASYVASVCKRLGYAFVNLSSPKHYASLLKASAYFGPMVLFVEDIDESTGETRNSAINSILNNMDSAATKGERQVFSIFTTNNLEGMERALLRPGRIDAIIRTTLPTVETSAAILSRYLGETVGIEHMDAVPPMPPAFLHEVASRAKYLARINKASALSHIPQAVGMLLPQLELVQASQTVKEPSLDKAMRNLVRETI
jgi:transitional endoplasmic reticulum ATPase